MPAGFEAKRYLLREAVCAENIVNIEVFTDALFHRLVAAREWWNKVWDLKTSNLESQGLPNWCLDGYWEQV